MAPNGPQPSQSDSLIAWAREHAHGPGEEYERTLYTRDDDPEDRFVQTWAEYLDHLGCGVVGLFAIEHRSEVRLDLTPEQALALAADLILFAHEARHARDLTEQIGGSGDA